MIAEIRALEAPAVGASINSHDTRWVSGVPDRCWTPDYYPGGIERGDRAATEAARPGREGDA